MLPLIALLSTVVAAPAPAHRAKAINTGPYFTIHDYPAEAMKSREEGVVEFQIVVGTSGRVDACNIVQSSGSANLDKATCHLLTTRARFKPARDAQGNPAIDVISSKVAWNLPSN